MRIGYACGQTPVVKCAPNRDSTHFFGALNLLNGKVISMRSPIMNSATAALFLQQLLAAYPDRPLLLCWDRATWHRGEGVKRLLAEHPQLEILCFPPGSPDLNPQEHVWKATRQAISHNHTETKLDVLAHQFEKHLNEATFPSSLLQLHDDQRICMLFN